MPWDVVLFSPRASWKLALLKSNYQIAHQKTTQNKTSDSSVSEK